MSTLLLNIGLHVSADNSPSGQPFTLSAREALAVIEDALKFDGQPCDIDFRTYVSDTEPTLVLSIPVDLDAATVADAVADLAAFLLQDAIAYTLDGVGNLVGPNAEQWGPFNPAYFILMDGSRMA